MSFDAFAVLAQPGASVTVHNIRLIDVQQAEGGHELLTTEHAGTTREDEAQEKQYQREGFAALLDDFERYGGKADNLFAAVQALVDK